MQPLIVSGLAHPLAPYFVLHQLLQGRQVWLTDEVALADRLGEQVGAALHARARAGTIASAEALLAGLGKAPAAPEAMAHMRFLTPTELATIGLAEPFAVAPATTDLCLVFDRHHLPSERSAEHCMQRIERAAAAQLRAGIRLRLFCLGAYVADIEELHAPDADDAAPLNFLVDQATALAAGLRRRVPAYLARWPLSLHQRCQQEMRCMPASRAAACLGEAATVEHTGHHLIVGAEALRIGAVLDAVIAAGGGGATSARPAEGKGKAATLLDSIAAQAAAHANAECADLEAARNGEFSLHQVAAPPADLALLLRTAQESAAALNARMGAGFAALPGLRSATSTRAGLRYHVLGSGGEVLLLVNAFGLTLDFWHMLACELGRDHRVVVLERPGAAHGAIPATYYADPDYLAAWLADCRAVLAAEQIDSCHVASWCSGAKFALELAHACPGTVRSLSLLAPSFAGMEGFAGRDSAYEQSLHTMCKVVDKMPKTAATMAATMLQMMEKNSRDLERFDPLRKDAVDILELADAHHQPALYQPFAGAAQLVDFSRQLMQFRSHDVRHLLTDAKLRVPVLLVTGSCDTTTSNERAKDLCRRLAGVAGFEIDGASHYLIHQEYALVAALLRGFLRDGLEMQCDRFRIQRSLFRQVPATAPATAPRAAQHVPG